VAADPYLQLTFDAKRRVALAARSVDLPPGALAWGLWEVWEDVWRRKDAVVPPLVLAGCLGTDPRLPAALVAFGFLMVEADGVHRLAPDDERRILLTHQQRVQAGKARAASAERSAGGMLVGRSSDSPAADQRANQRRTSGPPARNQRKPASNSQHPAASKSIAGSAGAAPLDPREGGDATYKALVAALFVLFREKRGADYAPSGRDWKALAELREKHEGSEIIRRWGFGLEAAYKARCDTFWDLRERWNALTAPEVGRGNRVPNGAATAADKDWS
jgi:hypothetical protein